MRTLLVFLLTCAVAEAAVSNSVTVTVNTPIFVTTFGGAACLTAPPPGGYEPFFRTNNFDVCVVGRKFGDVYAVKVQKVIQKGSGMIEIRGVDLETVTPAAANTAGGTAKGANTVASVMLPDWTVAELLTRFLSQRTASSVSGDLLQKRGELEAQRDLINRDLTKLIADFNRLILPVAVSAAGVSPSVETLINRLNSMLTGSLAPAIVSLSDEAAFKHRADEVDFLITDFKQLQKTIAAATVIEDLRLLRVSVDTLAIKSQKYDRNLQIAQEAARIAKGVSGQSDGRQFLNSNLRVELRKELFDKYKTSGTDETEINRMVDLFDRALAGAGAASPTGPNVAKDIEMEVDKVLGKGYSPLGTSLTSPLEVAIAVAQNGQSIYLADIALLNSGLAAVMSRMNEIQFASDVATPLTIPVSVTETGNLEIKFSLTRTVSYKPYQMLSTAPQSVATPGGGGFGTPAGSPPATPAAGAAAAAAAPAAEPDDLSNIITVRVHKFWRAAFVAGFAFSSLRERSYALQACAPEVPAPTGGTQPQCVIQSDGQRPQIHYIAGVHLYPWAKDSYEGMHPANRWASWRPGIFGGTALNKVNHYFIGPAFEPVLGMHFSGGYHFGRVNRLQQGVDPSKAAPRAALADLTRSVGDHGYYFMVGFDYKIFDKLFGGSKVKLVNP